MKRRILTFALCLVLILSLLPGSALAAQNTEDIVILYENDVHCAVEGYTKLAALKKELQQTYAHVGVVSSGDYIQGGSLGVVSQGEYIIELMNLVGYDALALGNHEFDYRLPRLEELVAMMDTKPVCCNFQKLGQETTYFQPYSLVRYGEVEVAYIGITTPSTVSKSSPAQFKDENGEYIYTFHPEDLYATVQTAIDRAKAEGADHIIALSHMGTVEEDRYGTIYEVIRNTQGLDVVLDAHSHSVIQAETLADQGGEPVLLSSTGTQFAYIGKLTISPEGYTTQLVEVESYTATDPQVDACLERINGEYSLLGERQVAVSQVELITHDAEGNRLVRVAETNLGNLCADAFRAVMEADIGYINGGGLRAPIPEGPVTFNHLLNVLPFSNTMVLAEVTGQAILDSLEMAMLTWPEETSFPHVSGLKFSFNTQIPSSVVVDEMEEFVKVDGQYRVYGVQVLDRETGKYVPLDLEKTYIMASHNYYLIENGSGMTMLKDAKILINDGMLDVEALEQYVVEDLKGVIGEEYRQVRPNITFTQGEVTPGMEPTVILAVGLGVLLALGLCLWLLKKKKQ